MSEEPFNAEYRCPGEHYAISRAVHLARLAGYYAACRECPRRGDTAGLSARQVRRLSEVHALPAERPLFAAEGSCDAAINDVSPQLARTIAIEFARRVVDQRPEPRPTVVFASDGRLATAAIVAAVAEGIRWTGCEAVDLGAASVPCMAAAIERISAEGGIFVGNPGGAAHTLGMNFWAGGEPISPGDFPDALADCTVSGTLRVPSANGRSVRHTLDRPARAFGPMRRVDAAETYLNELRPAYHALRPLKFLLQCGCGPVISYLEYLLRDVACRVLPAEAESDFGGQVVAAKAHFGIKITDDGENGRFFDEQGRPVETNRLAEILTGEIGEDGRVGQASGYRAQHGHERRPTVPDRQARSMVGQRSQGSLVPPYGLRQETFRRMKSSGEVLAADAAGRIWYAAGHSPVADALRTLTLLLVLLSRDDVPFSSVLDGAAGAR